MSEAGTRPSVAPATLAAPAPTLAPAPAHKTAGSRYGIGWLALPGVSYLLLVFALPLVFLLATSLRATDGGFSLGGYTAFFSDSYHLTVIWNTVKIAAGVTAICLLIGYPVAFAMARASLAVQGLMFLVLILPLSVGVVVKSFAWTILLRSNGLLNMTLLKLGLIDAPLRLLFNERGLVITAVHVFLPFMVLPIFTVARQIDRRLTDAAATLGAGAMYKFRHVVWPLSVPGVITGCTFVFSMAVSMYVIPALVVGDRYQTLPALVARAYLFMRDRQAGSTMAVVLLALAVLIVLISSWLARRVDARLAPADKNKGTS
ncbi:MULTISPECIES: ABC transporter permease [unclassified Achromobacter]|uniref:ABC transporter permease n=1 Tax=unclassified Achromobacter TaxID=2626865 RepID=UPI001E3EB133|nr:MULTISPECIES: ABC transporter permease [unclassified Achromobacter]